MEAAAISAPVSLQRLNGFNTQPPEGGCEGEQHALLDSKQFQHTATRRWLPIIGQEYIPTVRFQHTATRRWLPSTECAWCKSLYCFNTQPPEGGCRQGRSIYSKCHWFQHTATRRWLQIACANMPRARQCFNTQPPEGGCRICLAPRFSVACFNTQPPEGGCLM